MNELVKRNDFERVLAVFDSFVKRLETDEKTRGVKPKLARKNVTDDQLIPLGIMRLVVYSLLKMVGF